MDETVKNTDINCQTKTLCIHICMIAAKNETNMKWQFEGYGYLIWVSLLYFVCIVASVSVTFPALPKLYLGLHFLC